MPDSPVDQSHFRRMMARNIAMPLAAGFINIVFFVALVYALLSGVRMVNQTEAVIRQADTIISLAMDMQSSIRGYLITGDPDFLQVYETAKPTFATELQSLQEAVGDNQVQVERLKRVEAAHQDWLTYTEQVMAMYAAGEDYAALVRTRGKTDFSDFRRELFEFKNQERELLVKRDDQMRSIGIIAVIVYLLVSCLVTGILGYLGRRELILLSNTYARSFEERQRHAQQLEHQAWQRSGQARLAEKCMGQTALPTLGRTALDFLASYLNAAVGALYVRETENGVLKRVATYGVGKDVDQQEQTFAYGESLVEQALFSRRPLQLDEVPDNYLKINTGLGSASPRHIVLFPCIHDGVPNGVIELGFLRAPEPRDLEFLHTVSGNIGTTIEASLYRRRLQEALEQTQQLNEELQVQQEELRTANEELEEQSRVLEESQALLENQKAELEQTNEKLVEQALSLDDKNRALNRAQEELEERAAELQKASKYKSEFLANMSHELRTPLNSSMILAKILAENGRGNLDDEQVQFARSIYSAGNDLLNLINDILDISKVEAGKLELRPEYIDLRRLVQDLELTFQPLAGQKKLELNMMVASPALSSIITDRQRLEQILKNLMSNALKFTERGSISLTVDAAPDGRISFAVTDTGIGIAPDQQAIIFEAFQQGDGGINRRYGGTGLGLSISRDLAALLGGDIKLQSAPGEGSTFTLYLPEEITLEQQEEMPNAAAEAPPVKPAPAPVPQPALEKRKKEVEPPAPSAAAFADDREKLDAGKRAVLVIEDDLDFARILYNLAHDLGYQCVVAANASEGMRLAAEISPDAILLDIGLPDVSGMTVLQKLKRNSETRHIPVHIISASDRMEAALQMGAVGYAIKPTTRESLQQMFEKIEEKLTRKMKRVLLVEDDPLQRESIRHLIGEEDIEITAVETGAEAMELLRNTIFDCMIIDLKLPDMRGNDLLQRMSSETICSFPPVIVYTGRNLTRDEEHELLKYSRSIIIKGARSPERLLDEVTLFLHKVESDLSADRQNMLRTVRSRDSAIEGRRILLVDDDVRNIFALTGALEQKGATIVIARDGFEAVEKVNSVPDIDIVLMDIMMPGMDGLEATRRIRSDPRFQKLPIIAITAKAMKDDQEQCLKAGASDYLAKPIDIDRLYSLLRVWIPNMERL
jgi:Signal transduction histidine kinase